MQYLWCSVRWYYYRHILSLVLIHNCCCLPTPMTLASGGGGVRSFRLCSSRQLIRPCSQECILQGMFLTWVSICKVTAPLIIIFPVCLKIVLICLGGF